MLIPRLLWVFQAWMLLENDFQGPWLVLLNIIKTRSSSTFSCGFDFWKPRVWVVRSRMDKVGLWCLGREGEGVNYEVHRVPRVALNQCWWICSLPPKVMTHSNVFYLLTNKWICAVTPHRSYFLEQDYLDSDISSTIYYHEQVIEHLWVLLSSSVKWT